MKYAKAWSAIVAAVLAAVVAALTDGRIDPAEWINVAIMGAGAAAVLTAPNVPGSRYTKVILAVLTAVLTLAVSLITGGLTTSEILQLVLAGLGAVGVGGLRNSGDMLEQLTTNGSGG